VKYEVTVTVKTTNAGDTRETVHTFRDTWTFGDNPRWEFSGAAHAIKDTAEMMANKLLAQGIGGGGDQLNGESGYPQRMSS
jgi:hypothetical protein